jgi:hypothetical protein
MWLLTQGRGYYLGHRLEKILSSQGSSSWPSSSSDRIAYRQRVKAGDVGERAG